MVDDLVSGVSYGVGLGLTLTLDHGIPLTPDLINYRHKCISWD